MTGPIGVCTGCSLWGLSAPRRGSEAKDSRSHRGLEKEQLMINESGRAGRRPSRGAQAEGRGAVTRKSGASHPGPCGVTRTLPPVPAASARSPQPASEDSGKMRINGVGR